MRSRTLHDVTQPTTLYTTANVAEALPGLCTPLTWTAWKASQGALNEGYFSLGILTEDEIPHDRPEGRGMAIFYGRGVMNIDYLRRLADRLPGGSANAAELAFAGRVRPGLVDNPQPIAQERVALRLQEMEPRLSTDLAVLTDDAHQKWQAIVARSGDESATAAGLDLFKRGMFYQGVVTILAQGAFFALAAVLAELGRAGDEAGLTSGLGELEETRLLEDLWEVSRDRVGLEDFLVEWGFHGPREGVIESPSWREDNLPVSSLIESMKELDDDRAPAQLKQRRSAARRRLRDDVLSVAPRSQQTELAEMIERATLLIELRERGKSVFLHGIDLIRVGAGRAGERYAAAGALGSAQDVHYLTIEELLMDAVPGVEEIAARRGERESYLDVVLPPLFEGEPVVDGGQPVQPVRGMAGEVLTGTPASPGTVEGVVHVIHDVATAVVHPDTILVAALTDPSWTPHCLLASALVVDVGGPLSHAAIIAREVGVPCVIAVGDATARLRSGDRVRVDGAAGTVTLLETV